MKINLVIDKYHNDKRNSIKNAFLRHGFKISNTDYEMTLFVGGDGTFANDAINFIDKPVLFLSRHWKKPNGSISYNSQANIDRKSLNSIAKALLLKKYRVLSMPVLTAKHNRTEYKSIYDFFIERYATKEALRYKINVIDGKTRIDTYGISNGVIITTSLGSTGYYSYLDILNNKGPMRIGYGRIGIAHILPIKINDVENGKPVRHQIRRTFSKNAVIRVNVERDVGQMLFGMQGSAGVKIDYKKPVIFGIDKNKELKIVELGIRH
jgi:hypothetical protein